MEPAFRFGGKCLNVSHMGSSCSRLKQTTNYVHSLIRFCITNYLNSLSYLLSSSSLVQSSKKSESHSSSSILLRMLTSLFNIAEFFTPSCTYIFISKPLVGFKELKKKIICKKRKRTKRVFATESVLKLDRKILILKLCVISWLNWSNNKNCNLIRLSIDTRLSSNRASRYVIILRA